MNKIILGDCLEKLTEIDDKSIDCLITDPPYGISFMGKEWDKALPDVEIWKECFRVLKAGSFAFVFSIPRSDCQYRMMQSLEQAGFNISFTPIFHTFASGFPKAQNINKTLIKKFYCGNMQEYEKNKQKAKLSMCEMG